MGVMAWSVEERREYNRRWYQANREKVLARMKAKYDADPEPIRAYNREWKRANVERAREFGRRDYHKHRDARLETSKVWYAENKVAANERNKAWQKRNIAKVRAQQAEYRRSHPEKIHAQGARRRALEVAASGATYTTAQMIAGRVAMWGDACRYCRAPWESIDHRIPLVRGGSHWPANLVPACTSCNSRKGTKTESEFLAA